MLRVRAPVRAAPIRHAAVVKAAPARLASVRCAAPMRTSMVRVAAPRRSFATDRSAPSSTASRAAPAADGAPANSSRYASGAPRELEELLSEEDLEKALDDEVLEEGEEGLASDVQDELLKDLSADEINDLNADPMAEAEKEFKTPEDLAAFQNEFGGLDTGPINNPDLERKILANGIDLSQLRDTLGADREDETEHGVDDVLDETRAKKLTGSLGALINEVDKKEPSAMVGIVEELQRTAAETDVSFSRPSVYSWFKAIREFAKDGNPEHAEKQLAQCEAEFKPAELPVEVFADIITAYLLRTERRSPHAAFRQVERQMIRTRNPSAEPDFAVPDAVHALQRVDALLRRALSLGLKPSEELCTRAVDVTARHGRREAAEALLAEIDKAGIKVTSLALISTAIRAGQNKEAERHVERLSKSGAKDAGEQAQLAVTSMALAAADRGEWDEALGYAERVTVGDRATVYSALMHRMVKAGQTERAEKLLAQREQSPETLDALPYLSLAAHALRAGNVERARTVVKRMTAAMNGIPPLAYAPLMSALRYCSANAASTAARQAAAEWLAEMERVPVEQRSMPRPPVAAGTKRMTQEEVNETRKAVEALRAKMPQALRDWFANPTTPLKPAEREWLQTASDRFSPDPKRAAQALFLASMQARAEQSKKRAAAAAAEKTA